MRALTPEQMTDANLALREFVRFCEERGAPIRVKSSVVPTKGPRLQSFAPPTLAPGGEPRL